MKNATLLSLSLAIVAHRTHSFQPQLQSHHRPERRRVGFADWSDVKPNPVEQPPSQSKLTPLESAWTKYGLLAYVAHMCAFLPLSLIPTYVQTRLGVLSKSESEHRALQAGQKCARTLLRWIPFMNVKVTPYLSDDPQPTIWVSNHVSMLDTFVFLATDEELRGKNRRPLKTIYWKGLDANPICKILFGMAGFISIDMADNGNGNPNEYNRSSFKQMLNETRKAIDEGFDIFVLPEGQLNPTPEKGLQPILPGAYAISKGSKRPMQFVGLHGCHHLWHADESIGMTPVGRDVKIRAFPPAEAGFRDAAEFQEAFTAILGKFGATGIDPTQEELDYWLKRTE
ncbi:hypothetical protein ACHAXT_000169 [Thalassiosira profunda]